MIGGMNKTLQLLLFTIVLFLIGILYYWWVREATIVSEYLGINHYEQEISFRIDWFPSFVHQFSFVIFTWLAVEKSYMWFSLIFWFITNTFFELGQALPQKYSDYFPQSIANYFRQGTYSHEDMLALVVATLVAYLVMIKYKKKEV
jgi:hypothetical protein